MDGLRKIVLEKLSNTDASRDDWITLLDLSMERRYPEARRLAIEKITPTFGGIGIEQVVMARKYGVKQWLRNGLRQLTERDQFLSDADEEILGWNTVFKLCRLREQRFKDVIQGYSNRSYRSPSYGTPIPTSLEKEFGDELPHMVNEEISVINIDFRDQYVQLVLQ
jgi:hypothetical protein